MLTIDLAYPYHPAIKGDFYISMEQYGEWTSEPGNPALVGSCWHCPVCDTWTEHEIREKNDQLG